MANSFRNIAGVWVGLMLIVSMIGFSMEFDSAPRGDWKKTTGVVKAVSVSSQLRHPDESSLQHDLPNSYDVGIFDYEFRVGDQIFQGRVTNTCSPMRCGEAWKTGSGESIEVFFDPRSPQSNQAFRAKSSFEWSHFLLIAGTVALVLAAGIILIPQALNAD